MIAFSVVASLALALGLHGGVSAAPVDFNATTPAVPSGQVEILTDNSTVTIKVTSTTQASAGYIAFGFAANPTMQSADIVVVWQDKNGSTLAIHRQGPSNAAGGFPTAVNESQNQYTAGQNLTVANGLTTFQVSRPLTISNTATYWDFSKPAYILLAANSNSSPVWNATKNDWSFNPHDHEGVVGYYNILTGSTVAPKKGVATTVLSVTSLVASFVLLRSA